MKMRHLFQTFLFVCAVISLSSCHKSADYRQLVPDNAETVLSVNIQNLYQKSGIAENKKIQQLIKEGMDGKEDIQSLLKNPGSTGIDFSEPMYVFSMDNQKNVNVLMKVVSKKKVTTTLKELFKEKEGYKTEDSDGWSFIEIDDKALLAYNEEALLITNSGKTYLKNQIKESKEKKNNSYAVEQTDRTKGDICICRNLLDDNTTKSFALLSQYIPAGFNELLEEMKEYSPYTLMSVNFEEGKIAMTSEIVSQNKDFDKYMAKHSSFQKELNNRFLPFLTSDNLFLFSINIIGKGLTETYAPIFSNTENPTIAKIKEFTDLLNGEVTLAISDKLKGYLYAQVSDKEKLMNQLQEVLPMLNRVSDSEYILNLYGAFIRVVFNGNDLVVTNTNEDATTLFKQKNSNLSSLEKAGFNKDKKCAILIRTAPIKRLISNLTLTETSSSLWPYQAIVSLFSEINVTADSSKAQITLQMSDSKENALRQLIDLATETLQ